MMDTLTIWTVLVSIHLHVHAADVLSESEFIIDGDYRRFYIDRAPDQPVRVILI